LQRHTWGRCLATRALIRACASMCPCVRGVSACPCVSGEVVEPTPRVLMIPAHVLQVCLYVRSVSTHILMGLGCVIGSVHGGPMSERGW
jgi:hypothetical protein